MADWLHDVQGALEATGLAPLGVADGTPWQHVLPGCRSVVVVASGGRALWEAFRATLRDHPQHLAGEHHPLDAFVRRAIDAADPRPPPSRRWVRCSDDASFLVDFRPLARDAGLGWASRLGLLLHPEYGPWLGLRAACFTTEVLPVTGPLPGEGPCEGCPAPCVAACPGDAFPDDRWDVGACARFQRDHDACRTGCHSRRACPEGAAHAYSAEQLHYHSHRPTGRARLAEALGLEDATEGVGPRWDRWEG